MLYAAVGEGHVSTQSVIEKILASIHEDGDTEEVEFVLPSRGPSKPLLHSDSGVLVRGAPDILVKLAKCCTPVPGDAISGFGLLSDVTRVLSEHHVNILSATVSTPQDRLALSRFVFEMSEVTHLDRVLNAVRRIDAVYDVYRVSEG